MLSKTSMKERISLVLFLLCCIVYKFPYGIWLERLDVCQPGFWRNYILPHLIVGLHWQFFRCLNPRWLDQCDRKGDHLWKSLMTGQTTKDGNT